MENGNEVDLPVEIKNPTETKPEINLNKIYLSISEFVNSVHEHYFETLEETNKNAFKLYFDLFTKISNTTNEKEKNTLITGVIKGFSDFYNEVAKYSGNDTNKFLEVSSLLAVIPKKTVIKYKVSEKIYIPIANIIRKADDESKMVIGQYLFSIDVKISPTKEKMNQLSVIKKQKKKNPMAELLGLPADSEQADGFGEILDDVVGSLEKSGIDPENAFNGTGNTMKTFMAIYQSGVFSKLDEGFKSGKLMNMKDPKSMANMNSMLHNFIDKAMPVNQPPPQPTEIKPSPDDIPLD